MTENTSGRIGFFRRLAGIFFRDKVRNAVIREGPGVDPLLRLEPPQLLPREESVEVFWAPEGKEATWHSLGRCLRHVQLGGDEGQNQDQVRGYISSLAHTGGIRMNLIMFL